jgi:two-component system, NtrC family, sensor kinase
MTMAWRPGATASRRSSLALGVVLILVCAVAIAASRAVGSATATADSSVSASDLLQDALFDASRQDGQLNEYLNLGNEDVHKAYVTTARQLTAVLARVRSRGDSLAIRDLINQQQLYTSIAATVIETLSTDGKDAALGEPLRSTQTILANIINKLRALEEAQHQTSAAQLNAARAHAATLKVGTPIALGLVLLLLFGLALVTRGYRRNVGNLAHELSAEKALLDEVISTIPHLVYWKDATGKYAGANGAFRRWHGQLTDDQLLGRTESELANGSELSAQLALIEHEVSLSGVAVTDRQVTVAGPDGNEGSLLLSVLPQPGTAGRPPGLIGVGADVSPLTELEQQLTQARRLESIGQLAAGIAHEINTPVQFVSDNTRFVSDSFAGLLPTVQLLSARAHRTGPTEPGEFIPALDRAIAGVNLDFIALEVPGALEESLEGLGRISQIVLALKDFSHPGRTSAEADLNRAIETTVQVSRNEWKYLAELTVHLDPAVGLVTCHEGEIKQVLLNMIVNAAHTIQDRRTATGFDALGAISITTRRIGDQVQILIGDDGLGMDQATKERVFDPFFTTKEIGRGTGQGLSLAHATIVQKHSGSISVESAPGVGTTFTITLPVSGSRDDDPDRPSPTYDEDAATTGARR